MVARQLVLHDRISRRVGALRYIHGDHDHWHLTNFERFTLRLGPGRIRDDHKIGACLADGHRATEVQRAPRPAPALCGGKKPWLLGVRETMSSGWGDEYAPVLEGQWIDITGLPRGRYWLVHEVNPGRRLRESRYGNDVAAVLFSLRWRAPGIPPTVRIVKRCLAAARC
jgi:Lysyl oxidase